MYIILTALACICFVTLGGLVISAKDNSVKPETLDTKNFHVVNNFGLSLYKNLYNSMNNVFISPVSLYLTLGMISNGAASNTQKQLLSFLYFSNTMVALNTFNKDMQSFIINNRPNTIIDIASSIWINNSYKYVYSSFLNTNKTYYNSTIQALDFSNELAVDAINKWASDNTNGLIEQAISQQLGPDVMMCLLNTVYFKADWEIPFDKINTVKSDFISPKGKIQVDMMNIDKYFNYYENNLFQMVSLPYKDGKTSLLIILPKDDIGSVENNFTADNFDEWIKSLTSQQVVLSLPKVSVQYKQGLKTALSALGVSDMFDKEKADFKNISQNNLFVSDVIHNTVLKIDELGTEAAAVAGLDVSLISIPDIPPKIMNVNKPFFLSIYDNSTELILFEGSITNPQ
ncbi:MAG: serpin family protein [Oscillospiraceae bacterium]|nr:serpin family protein [Oscillospiraceae bacterium]